jgi:response regulator of citrate/malate metabolism
LSSRVRVLILIHQHRIESLANFPRQVRILHQVKPAEQKIVVIEHGLFLLSLHIRAEQGLQLLRITHAPRMNCDLKTCSTGSDALTHRL